MDTRYQIPPRFLEKLAIHITKNFLNLPGVRVPLILGIHGSFFQLKEWGCLLLEEQKRVRQRGLLAEYL